VAQQEQRYSAGFPDAVPRLEVRQRAAALRREQQDPARRGVPAADLYPARPSAAAARKVQALQATEEAEAMVVPRLAQAVRRVPPALQAAVAAAVQEAQQVPGVAAAQPRAAPEVWDVAVAPQPAAEPAGAVRRLVVAAVRDVAAVPRRAAGPASEAVQPRGAAEVPDAGVRRQAGRGAQGVLLLAAAWAVLPSIRCRGGRPAPSLWARSARAGGRLRTAQP
jgi:hypothetical protein